MKILKKQTTDSSHKIFFPIAIDISDKEILIIGGGKLALEKVRNISRFTEKISVIGKEVSNEIKDSKYFWKEEAYHKNLLNKNCIVYAATNDKKVNQQIREDCENLGILVNVVDNPQICRFISPAIYIKHNMCVAVNSGGTDVKKSISWRNRIKKVFEND